MDKKCVIFDVDGTLTTTKSGATFRKTADDWQWLPGRIAKIAFLHLHGVKMAVATNQGGVAFGYMAESDIHAELVKMCSIANFRSFRVCYTHPKASIEQYRKEDINRKPGPGMIQEIMKELDVSPTDVLFVGDREEDEQAAKNAGVDFCWEHEFDWSEHGFDEYKT